MGLSKTNHKISLTSRRLTTSYAFETGVIVLGLIPDYKIRDAIISLHISLHIYMLCIYM